MYFLCFTAYFTTPFAKYPEHFNQPLTEMASGPQFTTVEFGSLLPSLWDPALPFSNFRTQRLAWPRAL